ncbi:predicted protein [Lichtheimia corymbifera JMRC:FSU:9682]|uniref:Uncharacterized protein n=1 Tax=Lichtheimia corymbifera JMRC:FSU:9682 TaxID=1263082 RepID=A0A068SEJ1_9FUNG|nr:predicted protein [Lichtheimia corymbifera JMRC:FSU:9682]
MWIYASMASEEYGPMLINYRIDISYATYSLWDNSVSIPKDSIGLSTQVYDLGTTFPAVRPSDVHYKRMLTKFATRSFSRFFDDPRIEGQIHQFNRTFSDLRLSQLAMYLAAPSGSSLRLRYKRTQDGYDTTCLIILASIIAAMSLVSFIALKNINCLSVNNRSITYMIASATLCDDDQEDWRRSGSDITINGRLIMALDTDRSFENSKSALQTA